MSKFNQPQSVEQRLKARPDATENYEGGVAFKLTADYELYTRVASWLVGEPKFYDPDSKDTQEAIDRLIAELNEEDPLFVLQLASYAREELHLRSAPIYLLAAACAHGNTKEFIPDATEKIIRRADEITEVLAAYSSLNSGKNVPRSLKRGLDKALRNFDEYQLAKYDRKGAFTLRDAMRIIRPKPANEEQAALWGRLVKGNLKTPETWETSLSAGKGANKKQSWEQIIPKMGYMALLRNLRNFLKEGVDIAPVIARLTDEQQVRRSKQFPFRFYSAYKVIETEFRNNIHASRVLGALEDAIRISVNNLPRLKGRTFVACDNSGSMNSPISGKGTTQMHEIGNLMGAIAAGFCEDVIVAGFGNDVMPVAVNPRGSVFDNMRKITASAPGHATHGYKVPKCLIDHKIDVDRVIIFTDMQLYHQGANTYANHWASHYGRIGAPLFGAHEPPKEDKSKFNTLAGGMSHYRARIGHKVWLYMFDLSGYGTAQMPQDDKNTYLIGGWSEKVLGMIETFEQDPSVVLQHIREHY